MNDASVAAHPQASAAELARIVTQRPDLRVVVAVNPGAQPGLLDWLGSLGDPAVDAALARRRAVPLAVAPVTTGAVFLPQGAPSGSGAAAGPAPLATAVHEPLVQPYADEPRRSHKRLWIGAAVAAVLVVGLGAAAAWLLVLSKLGGTSTPEAAVTQLIEGVAHKDGIAVYGAVSPAETSSFGDMIGTLSELSGASSEKVASEKLLAVLDSVDVDLSGLELRSESIGDGLAKVTVVGGTLTVDGDGTTIAGALADAYGPVLASQGLSDEQTTAQWATAAQQIDDALPWSVSSADLVWHTGDADQRPFLVAVREGGSWYVSPLMTLGEYVNVEQGSPSRGAMPTGKGEPADSPEAAGAAFATALGRLAAGDAGPLADALPPAERRFVSVYAQNWLDAAQTDGSTPDVRVDHARFDVTQLDPDHVRLSPKGIGVSVSGTGDDVSATIDGVCVTDHASGDAICLDDSALGEQLGWDQVGLVAVEGDGGWRVSALGTLADWSSLTATKLRDLKASGELDDGRFLQQLLAPSLAGEAGVGLDLDDLQAAQDDAWMNGYTFDDEGNLLDPHGDAVPGWSFDAHGNLVDADGTVLSAS